MSSKGNVGRSLHWTATRREGLKMLILAIIATLGLASLVLVVLQVGGVPKGLEDNVGILQSAVTVLIVLVGGIWALFKIHLFRTLYPHLTIAHVVTGRRVGNTLSHIEVAATLHNTSQIKVEIQKVLFRLQQVSPSSDQELRDLHKEVFVDGAKEDLQWPVVDEHVHQWKEKTCIVEPGEELQLLCEFIVSSNIKTVLAYTYVENAKHKDRSGHVQGWPRATVKDIIDSQTTSYA